MSRTSLESIQVLFVDDEPGFAEIVAERIEALEPKIDGSTAMNAEDALELIRSNEFHCVVSDYSMTGIDGIEFLVEVRIENPDLPFILYTGKGSEEVASRAISSGVTDYLQKDIGTSHYDILCNRIGNSVDMYQGWKKPANY